MKKIEPKIQITQIKMCQKHAKKIELRFIVVTLEILLLAEQIEKATKIAFLSEMQRPLNS